jgi:hypothetical protein
MQTNEPEVTNRMANVFITKHERLENLPQAIAAARNPEHIKVVVDIE